MDVISICVYHAPVVLHVVFLHGHPRHVRAAAGEIVTGTFKVIEVCECGFGQIAGIISSTLENV